MAVSGATTGDDPKAVRAAVAKLNPGVRINEPRSTPVPGLFRTSLDGSSGYVTADGRYFIIGDMYEVASRRNLSEEARKQTRVAALAQIKPADAIVFAPARPKHTITVFTDVDCGYCRKLHGEIAQYNELGIAVRYVAYPRSGPATESWRTMEAVWCAKDRRDALTRAKLGEKVDKPASCGATPIAEHYALGDQVGVHGTPLILLEDGRSLDGYMPASRIAAILDKKPSTAPVASAAR